MTIVSWSTWNFRFLFADHAHVLRRPDSGRCSGAFSGVLSFNVIFHMPSTPHANPIAHQHLSLVKDASAEDHARKK